MYPRSTTREKVLAVGTVLVFLGLGGFSFLNPHGILRITADCFLLFGWFLNTGAFFAGARNSNRAIRRVTQNPGGVLWLRVLAIVLWMGILPLIFLSAYRYIHRP